MRLNLLRTRVARRVLLLFLLGAILPVTVLSIYGYDYLASALEERARADLRAEAKSGGMMVLDRIGALGATLAQLAALPRPLLESDGALAPSAGSMGPRFNSLHLRLEDGTLRALRGDSIALPALSVAQRQHLRTGGIVLLVDPSRDRDPDVYLVSATDQRRAELWGRIDPASVWRSDPGRSLASPGVSICLRVASGATLACGNTSFATALSAAEDGAPLAFRSGNESWMGAEWTLFLGRMYAAPSWRLGIAVSEASVRAPLARFRQNLFLGLVLLLVVVFFLTHVQLRRQMQPLEALEAGTRRVAAGNFTEPVTVQSRDEFATLAESFNGMADDLRAQFLAREAMAEVSNAALGSPNPTAVMEAIFRGRSVLFGGSGLTLALARGDDPFWWRVKNDVLFGQGQPPRDISPPAHELDELRARPEGFVVRRGERSRSYFEPPGEVLLREAVVIPLFREGELAGALVRPSAPEEEGAPAPLARLKAHATQIGVAIANTKLLDQLDSLSWGALTALARTIDAASPWTAGHSERVTQGAVEIGRRLGLPDDDLDLLHRGGLLHDIGKIGVPTHILDKPGALTEEELVAVRAHPAIGARILAPIAAFRRAIPLVLHHHEALDGSGYPHGLSGDQIPLIVRILTVADVFDALVSERPYRAAWPAERAIALLQEGSGTKFDPRAVGALAAATSTGWRPRADGLILTPEAVVPARRSSGGKARMSSNSMVLWPAAEPELDAASPGRLVSSSPDA